MPSLLQSLFPCFGGGGEEQPQPVPHEQTPAKRREPSSLRSGSTSTYATPIPVSQTPGSHKSPTYRPHTDKKLPPKPGTEFAAIELPGSSPNLHEMAATHVPGSYPLARSSNATSADLPRPSQQSERTPHSPYSTHSTTLTPGSPTGSSYRPSGSVRAPSERDPDEISPVRSNAQDYPRGAKPNMYSNVADALTDRKRMFERLRKANDVVGQNGEGAEMASQATSGPQSMVTPQSAGAVTPVEMWAPVQQPPPSEPAGREHVRNPSEPKELE